MISLTQTYTESGSPQGLSPVRVISQFSASKISSGAAIDLALKELGKNNPDITHIFNLKIKRTVKTTFSPEGNEEQFCCVNITGDGYNKWGM